MKISPIKNTYFKGHDARRIKALYMTNPGSQRQLNIYNQLLKIGQQESFDVFMHTGKELKNETLTAPEQEYNFWGVWSQDNKIIRFEEGEPILITCKHQPKDEFLEAQIFTQNRQIKGYETELIFDGGDIFLGKKDNEDNYLITSTKTLYLNAIFQYLKNKNPNLANRKAFIDLINFKEYKDSQGEIIATLDECSKESEKWEELAKSVFCEVMNVKEENLIFIPENEFHLDLTIRPLNYPYVLVNDDKEVDRVIKELEKKFGNNFNYRYLLKDLKDKIAQQRENYFPSAETIKVLENAGFKPIKIAGMYGRGPINFINAIVHKKDDDFVYITNATKNENDLFNAIQDEFEKDLLNKCPQIKRVYFISGENVGKDLNDIMIYLKDYYGGIHCLCAEEMME